MCRIAGLQGLMIVRARFDCDGPVNQAVDVVKKSFRALHPMSASTRSRNENLSVLSDGSTGWGRAGGKIFGT